MAIHVKKNREAERLRERKKKKKKKNEAQCIEGKREGGIDQQIKLRRQVQCRELDERE